MCIYIWYIIIPHANHIYICIYIVHREVEEERKTDRYNYVTNCFVNKIFVITIPPKWHETSSWCPSHYRYQQYELAPNIYGMNNNSAGHPYKTFSLIAAQWCVCVEMCNLNACWNVWFQCYSETRKTQTLFEKQTYNIFIWNKLVTSTL